MADELLNKAFLLVAGEEMTRQLADKFKVPEVTATTPPQKTEPLEPASAFIDIRNLSLTGSQLILRKYGRGKVEECMIKANGTTFMIEIVTDNGEPIIFDDYAYYLSISDYVECIDVFEDPDNDVYVFKINNINFSTQISITVVTSQQVNFPAIFINYKLAIE